MTALEIIKKEIKKLSTEQLKKVKGYIDNIAQTTGKLHNKRKRVKTHKNSYNEYYGIYNYSKDKIDTDLKKMRMERSRENELSD